MMRALVTGLGVVSPIGISVETFWRALCAGRSHFTAITPVYPGMKDGCITSRLSNVDRAQVTRDLGNMSPTLPDSSAYAVHAALQAIQDAGLAPGDSALRNALVCVGNNEAEADILDELVEGNRERWKRHPYAGHSIADAVSLAIGSRGPAYTVHNTCASGNVALEVALRMLKTGIIKTAVIGGGDVFSKKVWSGFHTLNALGPAQCRPFSVSRRYITIAEGGAFLVLQASEDVPDASRAYAELLAAASNNDAQHPTNPDLNGVTSCHLLALSRAGLSSDQVDAVFAHGTGTKANDAIEARIFSEHYQGAAVTAIKGTTGHLMATAGALGAVASCLALRDQILPPTQINSAEFEFGFDLVLGDTARSREMTYVQNNSFGFGGNNAITIFKAVR
ncbi:3-oxoacyl-[acyl-carrier-protein] synthase II [Pseudomonas sp. NFACC02]|uniref:beta-ketoacyl-[acyl-carrier-protein] synthase family protein n=1 Tax=Pseudomonas sp. NFACC02 TaxID=1566250 RepID=UPI0008C0E199|nr:beta-ketoacyl-[acyl-carrier-protein] synthase family protein [Pseudomonas sp. NFACC02]SEQ54423.1 3-oxoacyl-[acyl-carrier-protein] synthase II [Pseudomonas sp. NFACC02]